MKGSPDGRDSMSKGTGKGLRRWERSVTAVVTESEAQGGKDGKQVREPPLLQANPVPGSFYLGYIFRSPYKETVFFRGSHPSEIYKSRHFGPELRKDDANFFKRVATPKAHKLAVCQHSQHFYLYFAQLLNAHSLPPLLKTESAIHSAAAAN